MWGKNVRRAMRVKPRKNGSAGSSTRITTTIGNVTSGATRLRNRAATTFGTTSPKSNSATSETKPSTAAAGRKSAISSRSETTMPTAKYNKLTTRFQNRIPVKTRSGSANRAAAARSRGRPTRKARISSCDKKKRAVSLAERKALRAISASMATMPASHWSVECRNSLIAVCEPDLPVPNSGWQRSPLADAVATAVSVTVRNGKRQWRDRSHYQSSDRPKQQARQELAVSHRRESASGVVERGAAERRVKFADRRNQHRQRR